MQFTTTTAAIFLAAVLPTAMAGRAIVQNNCQSNVYLTITRSNQQSSQTSIAPGTSYSETINGQGNSFGVTTSQDYYSPNTGKLIWGFSDAAPTLYYSVNSVNGNPFANNGGFKLTSSDGGCGTVNQLDGRTRTCGDNNDFTLTTCQS